MMSDTMADVKAEGCDMKYIYSAEGFQQLWDSINKKRGYGWYTNPWVWVIRFRRLDTVKVVPTETQ